MQFGKDFNMGDQLTLTDTSGEGTMVATVEVVDRTIKDEFEKFRLRILEVTDFLGCPEDQKPKPGDIWKVGRAVGVSSSWAGWSLERLN